MASIGHVALGLAAARGFSDSLGRRTALVPLMIALSALSLLPDADVVAFRLGIPYAAPFGHRGASHSLAFAVLVAMVATVLARPLRLSGWRVAALVFAIVASHPLLDVLTDGGLGCALLFPFSNERFFAPWRPIPVAPIGRRLLSDRGARVMLTELAWFAPFLLYALWPRRRREG
jgi:inner membrane protein